MKTNTENNPSNRLDMLDLRGGREHVLALFEAARNRFEQDLVYGKDYDVLKEYFSHHPENTDEIEVLTKVRMVDLMYSTNLDMHKDKFTAADVANVILKIPKFDELVRSGDCELPKQIVVGVMEAQTAKGIKSPVNIFSFATKYCCLSNGLGYGRDDYSIYDSLVAQYLPICYRKSRWDFNGKQVTRAMLERWRCDADYDAFADCVNYALAKAKLEFPADPGKDECFRRDFDHLLWCVGKGMLEPKTGENQPK